MKSPAVAGLISGPQNIARYTSARYVANGGEAGSTYEWTSRQRSSRTYTYGAWQAWYSTGTDNFTFASINACGLDQFELRVRITSPAGSVLESAPYTVYISNPC